MFYRRMSLGAHWSDGRVYGLQDPAEDAPILNRPLNSTTVAATQNSVTGPAIVLGATTYASPALHASLTAAAASSAAPVVRLGRDETSLARFADPLRRLERRDGKILFDAWAIAAGTTVDLDDEVVFERAPVV